MSRISTTPHRPTRVSSNGNGNQPPINSDSASVTTKPRRRPPPLLVGLGVAVVAFGAFVLMTPGQPRSVPVLVVRAPVAPGGVIAQSDLSVLSLATPKGLAVLPSADESAVVGSHAVGALAPGELLASSDYTTTKTNQVTVGLSLHPGQFPNNLAPGMQVAVLLASSKSTAPSILADSASVTSVVASAGSPQGVVVTLGVSSEEAGPLALASASGNVVVVILP